MERQSYEDGRTGQASGPNTDTNAYRTGQAERDGGTYNPSWETGGKKEESGGGTQASYGGGGGSILGLVFLAPFIMMAYPAIGLSVLAIVATFVAIMNWLHVEAFTVMMSTLLLAIGTFFAGVWVEGKVSQIAIYRGLRKLWRFFVASGMLAGCVYKAGINKGHFDIQRAIENGDKAAVSLVVTVIGLLFAFWMVGKADRAYFPVASLLHADEEKAKAATPVKSKGKFRRFMICLVWFVPVTLIVHVIIRLLVDGYFRFMTSEADMEGLRLAFYKKNMVFIYIADVAAWLLFLIKGILPGTDK